MKLWCNTHERLATYQDDYGRWHCQGGGIMLPCRIVDLDEIGIELIEDDDESE